MPLNLFILLQVVPGPGAGPEVWNNLCANAVAEYRLDEAVGRHDRDLTPGYDCLDAWISSTTSPRTSIRCSAWWEKMVLPSTTTSSTPRPAELILAVRFSCFLISRLRRPASRRMLIQVKQRLISMFMASSVPATLDGRHGANDGMW